MGFSLAVFIGSLEHILERTDMSDKEKIELIQKEVFESKQYAKECGQL